MQSLPMNRFALLVAGAASVLVLSACVPTPPAGGGASPTPRPTETVVAEEPTEEEPAAPSDVLFIVTAATTDSMGSPVTLTMTGHAPQHWDAPGRESITNDFITQCTTLGGGSVWDSEATLSEATLDAFGSTLMVIDVESTPAGRTLAPIELFGGSFFYQQVSSGDIVPATDFVGCTAGNRLETTGSGTIITNYENGSTTGDLSQWLAGGYGFGAAFGSSVTFTSCTTELTPLAQSFDLASLPGWDAATSSPTDCWIGYRGE